MARDTARHVAAVTRGGAAVGRRAVASTTREAAAGRETATRERVTPVWLLLAATGATVLMTLLVSMALMASAALVEMLLLGVLTTRVPALAVPVVT